jgi:hypothetical protein
MEAKTHPKASFPPHFFAVQIIGVLLLSLGVITFVARGRPSVFDAIPWLSMPWVSWVIFCLGGLVVISNGVRLVRHARRNAPRQ